MKKIKNFTTDFKSNWPALKKKMLGTEGIIYGAISIIVVFALFVIIQSCTPRKGSILFGMCSAFIEINVPFPETVRHIYVEQYRKAVRIYYTHVDSFGQTLQEDIECSFFQDPYKGVQLELVYFNNIKDVTKKSPVPGKGKLYQVEQEHIDLFNNSKSPSAIINSKPDLALPN